MESIEKIKNKEIRQSNSLTEARFEMSALELDLLFYILSQLQKDKYFYQINTQEMQTLTDKKHNYQELREATFKLRERTYEIKKEKSFLQIGIFSSCEYTYGTGVIEIEISPKMTPYLFGLKEQFTSFRLLASLNMSSKYAKRIYTMLSQWKDMDSWKISIEDLKTRLNLIDPKGKEPEQYKSIKDFRKNVLEPATNQINQYTELKVSYKLIKKGRSFKDIEFSIKLKEKSSSKKELNSISDEDQRCIKSLEEIGIKRKDIIEKIIGDEEARKKTFKWIYDWKMGKFGKVGNPAGLFLKTMGLV